MRSTFANWFTGSLFSAAAAFGLTCGDAYAQSANVKWGPWAFRWEVAGSSGISVRDVNFDGKKILHKGSMPVIRVKYDNNACGPYQDRISWGNFVTDNNCDDGQKICKRQFSFGGHQWLEISGRVFIGSYDIIQIWYFSDDGHMQPRLFSRGLQCRVNHQHHAYWMLDFDIDGSSGDEAFLHSPSIGNSGYGNGWFRYSNEFDSSRPVTDPPTWFARDMQTLRGVMVTPGSTDKQADSFSTLNAGIRQYHSGETDDWQFGATGELGYKNGESVINQDNVLWYVAHLNHLSSEGPDHYQAVGPRLSVKR
jgi:Copper amine oxidase, enzyme domain